MDLNAALNIPLKKGGNTTLHNLHQQGLKKAPAGSDLRNLKNMGYEGEFYFGNPNQKMQVIFDTGSPAELLGSTLTNVRPTIAPCKTKSMSKANLLSSITTTMLAKSSNTEEELSLDTHLLIDSASPKAKITASTTSLS